MNVSILSGKGSFTDNNGLTVSYPIYKLKISNSNGDYIEQKLDKINKKLISYLFDLVSSNNLITDENGNEVEVIYLKEKTSQNVNVNVE